MQKSFRSSRKFHRFSCLGQWPLIIAAIVALVLVLGGRSAVNRLHGQDDVSLGKHRSDETSVKETEKTPIKDTKKVLTIKKSEQRQCRTEQEADYDGEDVVQYGDAHTTQTAADCCSACLSKKQCNVWVWCGAVEGCMGDRSFGECWLKHARNLNLIKPSGRRQPGIGWVSGTTASETEYEAAKQSVSAAETAEIDRLAALRANESLPLVFFDVEIKEKPVGRIEMVLFVDTSPRCAENFRQFVTGEAGRAPKNAEEGGGQLYHFKGAPFYRIIDRFIDQSGVNVESVYGGQFKDDAGGLKLKHDRSGLLSMANMGPDTNTNHFSIMMGPAPHLDGSYTIFGQVVTGFDVVRAVNQLSVGKLDNTATAEDGAAIAECGQLRKGSIVPNLKQ